MSKAIQQHPNLFLFRGFRELLIAVFIFAAVSNLVFAQTVTIYRGGVAMSPVYSTITAASAASVNGDSLVLSAHTFYESVDAHTKHIQYQGTINSGDTTTIDGAGGTSSLLWVARTGSIRDIIFQNVNTNALYIESSATPSDTFRIGGNTIFRNVKTSGFLYVVYGLPNCLIISDNTKIVNNECSGIIQARILVIKGNVLIEKNDIRKAYLKYGGLITSVQSINISGKVKIINNTTDSTRSPGVCILDRGDASPSYIGDTVTISGNRCITPNWAKGGALYIVKQPTLLALPGIKTFTLGAINFENNEAYEGGAVFIEDSSYNLILNGTRFSGNTATKGGAIYCRGGLIINKANFEKNQADTGAAIYINTNVAGSAAPYVTIENTRFFDPKTSGKSQPEIFARYEPSTAIAPAITLNSNWWGKSDTIGVLRENPKGLSTLSYWAVANWSVKNGTPVVKADTTFPVSAEIKYNHGLAFPASSFAMLKGTFTADTGTFTPLTAAINSSNIVSSMYKTFKDTFSKSANADIVAWIDADTFRKTVLVWSIDTLPTTGGIKNKSLAQVLIYPNPAKDVLNIQGIEAGSRIELYDIMGKLVLQQECDATIAKLNVEHLTKGIYTLKITTKEGNEGSAKVMKE